VRTVLVLLLALMGLALAACNLSATGQPATATAPPDRPVAEILFPANNARVYEGTDLLVDIVARDAGAGVARLILLVDGEPLNDASPTEAETVPVFRAEMNWIARGLGMHVLSTIPYRLDGTRGDEVTIVIEVVEAE
jgi:hypothetical protein